MKPLICIDLLVTKVNQNYMKLLEICTWKLQDRLKTVKLIEPL